MAFPDLLGPCSDEDLLASFRGGDREAFGTLLRRYEAELYGYLRRYLGNNDLAEDVFQNTFLQVFLKINQFEAGRPFRPWLYTIATHQAIDALRRNGRHQGISLDQQRTEVDSGEWTQLLDLLEGHGPCPLEQLQESERRRLVQESVQRLPETLRQVLVLVYYQGLKYQDVADIIGIPVGTVKSRLHASLVRLQEAWAAEPALKDALR